VSSAKILLCVTKTRYEERRIYDYLLQKGAEVDILLDSMDFPQDTIGDYQLGIIRSLSHSKSIERALYLQLFGIRTLNTYSVIHICNNKLVQSISFQRYGLPVPMFRIGSSYNSLREDFSRFSTGMIIKPLSSSWGRGIARIMTSHELEAWIAAMESTDLHGISLPVLLQENINKGNSDIRVVVVGKDPIVAFRRITNDSWKTNTHLGSNIEVIDLRNETPLLSLVSRLTEVLGQGIYGLDFLYDHTSGKYMICEVNHNPEFALSWKIHGVDVAEYIADEAIRQIGGEL